MRNQIVKYGWKVQECSFELFAFGPLHEEQKEKHQHNACRDILAALERDLADELRARGHVVVGDHRSKAKEASEILLQILNHKDFTW